MYGDLAAMLREERLDFIDILSAPWLHRAHCLQAKDAGVHIICQKPLCDALEDARALVAEMTGYPKLFAVHENHPYRPWFRQVADLHREGFFGTPRLLRLEQYDAKEPPEAYKNEAALGVLLEYGTHLVDMVLTLLGAPARRVRASTGSTREREAKVWPSSSIEYPEATAIVDIGVEAGRTGSWRFRLGRRQGCRPVRGHHGPRRTVALSVSHRGTLWLSMKPALPTTTTWTAFYRLRAGVCGLHARGNAGDPVGRAELPDAGGDLRGVSVGRVRSDCRGGAVSCDRTGRVGVPPRLVRSICEGTIGGGASVISASLKVLDWLCDISSLIILYVTVAVIFVQVICRYVLEVALPWTEEFARYAFLWLIFLANALAERQKEHFRVSYFVEQAPAPGPLCILGLRARS
ncbi:MAG: TRAP transporter small permease subunit [Anaerotruncus sp.]|nr:TRAP transporter small permease subunit [Anaerotruncus sp.]